MTYDGVNPIEGSADVTSTSLLRSARADDQTAWARLVGTYGRLIYRWARSSGLQSADAADVVQETLRAVARGLKDFHHGRPGETFRGWLRQIAQNKVHDHFRRQNRTVEGRALEAWDDSQWAADDEPSRSATVLPPCKLDWEQRLNAVQAEFSARNWQIFWRVVVDGQETAEVAEEFRVSANVVRLVKSRVLKRLRETWQDVRGHEP